MKRQPSKPDYKRLYPTRGDLAREQVRRHNKLYMEDVAKEVSEKLLRLKPAARRAFALACAERAFALPYTTERLDGHPALLEIPPILNVLWQNLAAGKTVRPPAVRAFVSRCRTAIRNEDDPLGDIALVEGAWACILAAQCFFGGDATFASQAAESATEAVYHQTHDQLDLDPNNFVWDPDAEPEPSARISMQPAVQNELLRQLADLAMLEREDITVDLLARLRGRDIL